MNVGIRYKLTQYLTRGIVLWRFICLCNLIECLCFLLNLILRPCKFSQAVCTMWIDARDRLGVALEQLSRRAQIERMLLFSGLRDIKVSDVAPFWCPAAFKA
jgi:hypothetical protein